MTDATGSGKGVSPVLVCSTAALKRASDLRLAHFYKNKTNKNNNKKTKKIRKVPKKRPEKIKIFFDDQVSG